MKSKLLLLVALLTVWPALAQEFSGVVVGVTDGDTLKVKNGKKDYQGPPRRDRRA